MIKNYLRSAIRNIARHKFISFINIFGLTIGLTCCLLILAYIINQRSYDRYNKNADDVYRVTRIFYSAPNVESLHLGTVAPPFGPLLQNAFPDIKKMTRLYPNGTIAMRYNDKLFNEKNSFFADENLTGVFDLALTKGDPHTALNEPYSVMLTEGLAKKYFGNEDPMNKGILFDNNKHEFKVTGVYKAFPSNSHIHPELLLSFNTLKDPSLLGEEHLRTNYGNNSFFTYLLFPPNYNIKHLEEQLPAFLDKYVVFKGMKANLKTSQVTKLTLQKLTDIHLHSHLDYEAEENGDIKQVYIFSAIALFILLIACINYMNLSTARSALRAKEIGIRKVIGAQRKEIVSQFLSESVLITWFALLLAIGLTVLLVPLVNKMSDQHLSIQSLMTWQTISLVLALPFIIGLISGIYPALFMSSFIPVKVLKGMLNVGSGSISFRKVLVVVQFSISIILIVATTIVFQQLQYIQNKSLGFSKDHVVVLAYPNALSSQFNAFRTDLLKNPGIKEVGRSSRIPSGRLLDDQGAQTLDASGTFQPVKVDLKNVSTDLDFIPTFGIKMAAGRNFSRAFATDTSNYVINEAAVRELGWKTSENAIGKDINYGGVKGKVIGVMRDFHFESLHQKIIPLLFQNAASNPGNFNVLSVKINSNNIKETLSALESTWHKYLPQTPFDHTFLDDKFGQLYNSEQQQGNLFTIFSCIAIFIACLGLFGLSAFTITQRVKEIGIRKVLGASIPQIVTELSKDFLKLVIVAAVIALPVAWYSMDKWLLDFAFRIQIAWWVFLMAGILALVIAFVTISFQSIKAAIANPVKSLRSE